ncbi:MAG: type II toxin-antitoxin system VapC family toxin [Candidatus Dadabacteria bacterium]|nr:type II toxin-antitoxin system VapC family toxin [Candidatus Dadabacteria bacterium]
MTRFVLDNSVVMRWFTPSSNQSDRHYADRVLESMNESEAVVPGLFYLEASNVLICSERRGETTIAQTEDFTSQLENLPISVDSSTWRQSFGRTMVLARSYGLSSYDAAYLELAVRESLTLASLDRALIKAAEKAGIGIYLAEEHENA